MLSAAVIGLGNIGMDFDIEEPDGTRVLTHATGFYYHPNYDLVAGVDPDSHACRKFEKKFGRPAFRSVDELYDKLSPDVVSIGVPTVLHFPLFKELIHQNPKAIICEKPIASTPKEGEKMIAMAQAAHCELVVNYMRRFEPGVIELKKRIGDKEFGDIYKGTVWYSKGILNNGSHFIDLLIFLFGAVQDIVLLDGGRINLKDDPEPDLKIVFGELEVYFIAGREEYYSIKEIELMGTAGSIRYSRGGEEIVLRKPYSHELFPQYTVLEKEGKGIATDLKRYQYYVAEALYQALTTGAKLNSTGETALETAVVVEIILKKIQEAAHV